MITSASTATSANANSWRQKLMSRNVMINPARNAAGEIMSMVDPLHAYEENRSTTTWDAVGGEPRVPYGASHPHSAQTGRSGERRLRQGLIQGEDRVVWSSMTFSLCRSAMTDEGDG